MAANGFILCFSLYSEDIKDRYNLSQTQLSILTGAFTVANCMTYIAGLFFEKFGSFITYLLYMVLGTASSGLIYLSTFYEQFHHNQFWLLVMYFIILGYVLGAMYITTIAINIKKIHHKHSGFVIGVSSASWYLFFVLNSFICNYSDICEIRKIFGAVTLIMFLSNIVIALLEKCDKLDLISIDDRNIPLVNQCEENYSENSEDHSGEEATNQFGMNVFFTGSYQLMLWSFAFTWSVAFAVIFSVKTFVLSLKIDFSLFTLDTIGALLMLVSNLVMPALSDLLLERIIPRTIWCLIFVTMQTVFTFFSVWYGSMLSIFITYILVMFLSNATNMSIIPAIINDFFGAKHFSRNYGFIFMLGDCSIWQ